MGRTPASVGGHPLHSMLVALPIGLWIFSLVCDLVYRFGSSQPIWYAMAWYAMVGGVIGALVAAVPGLIDFNSIKEPTAGSVALLHLSVNVGLVLLFSVNAWIRTLLMPESVIPIALSVIGIAGLAVSGWLGGELVYRHAVGVTTDASVPREKRDKRAA